MESSVHLRCVLFKKSTRFTTMYNHLLCCLASELETNLVEVYNATVQKHLDPESARRTIFKLNTLHNEKKFGLR